MKKLLIALSLVLSTSAWPQAAAQRQPNNSNVPSQAGALRVNTPTANQQLAQNFVHVTYQLVDRGVTAAISPNFTVQLDGTDPVSTTAYEYTFTGLAPGTHTITVTLVDANGAPIANSSVSTKFTVADGNRAPQSPSSRVRTRHVPVESAGVTPLPMLSLVGFAVLLGGISTAIRNR